MKKIFSLGIMAALSLTLFVGCGGEPKDHIWEAKSEIKKAKSFEEAMVQIDGMVFPDLETKEMTFVDLRDCFDQEQYSIIYNDHGKENEMNTDNDSWEFYSNQVVSFENFDFKVYNQHLDGENNYIGKLCLTGKGSRAEITTCPAKIKEFNDEYKGAIYLAGGVPASKGAVKKTDAANYEDAEKYFKDAGYINEEDVDLDDVSGDGILKVYKVKDDKKIIVYVVSLNEEDGKGFRAAEVVYKYKDGKIDKVEVDLDETYRVK